MSHHPPVIYTAILRRKADADLEDLTRIVRKGSGVPLFINLLKSGFDRVIDLDLDNIDEVIRLQENVDSAVRRSLFYLNIFAHQLQDDVHCVLKIPLGIALNLIAGLGE